MLSSKLHSSIGTTDQLYVDDVFSAYTYTGNGSTQTINNGIDLAGKGGMVWAKKRTAQHGNYQDGHRLQDTTRGAGDFIDSSATTASSLSGGGSFLSNGLVMAGDGATTSNSHQFISWTFRKAPKFFDVVTYTGNGASSRAIAHSLGQEVGMVMTKATSTAGDWNTYHRSATGDLVLNGNNAQTGSKALVNSATTSTFMVSGAANTNAVTYVAYLFAHDPSADGIIQCGSYVGNSSATGPVINLGWEPQYLLIKRATVDIANWRIVDVSRGMPVGQNAATLQANLSASEGTAMTADPLPTGFQINTAGTDVNASGSTYIYLAIRRPNKPPTTGTQVYNAVLQDANNVARTISGAGFAPDLLLQGARQYANGTAVYTRLSGRMFIGTSLDNVDYVPEPASTQFTMDGIQYGAIGALNHNGLAVNWLFRRAPGFFDVVCWSGNGSTDRQINHSLGATPELVIAKRRNNGGSWVVAAKAGASYGADTYSGLFLQSAAHVGAAWGEISKTTLGFTESMFNVGVMGNYSGENINGSGFNSVAYLFASLPGISKVGTYTGNGSSQTINCGFATGARFVLIKRTDSTGAWFVWDTARGIVSANDPHLSLNTAAAEVTTNDSIDPDSTGFIVNQVAATNINVTSATYSYLAIA